MTVNLPTNVTTGYYDLQHATDVELTARRLHGVLAQLKLDILTYGTINVDGSLVLPAGLVDEYRSFILTTFASLGDEDKEALRTIAEWILRR